MATDAAAAGSASAAVFLCEPKFAHNVGNALRACALLGAGRLYWTGDRVPGPEQWPPGTRLPREERLKCYARTELRHVVGAERLDELEDGATPVCVEISPGAEDLRDFLHPEHALYVFGPEDGSVTRGVRSGCHRFVRIPTADPDERTPYNLAFCVGAVLLDRLTKQTRPWLT